MTKEHTFFVLTICTAFLGAFLLVFPFIQYLVFGLLLTYILHPLKRRVQLHIRNRILVALLMILLILVAVILPTVYLATKLVREIRATVSMVTESPNRDAYLEKVEGWIQRVTGEPADLHVYKNQLIAQVRGLLVRAAPDFLGSISEWLLGFFVMLFVMFYSLQSGRGSFERVRALIPLAPNLKDKLIEEIKSVTWAVVYGQVMTALIQGALGGLGFLVFGVPNAILWGSIMILLSFLPLIGTPVIWAPAAIFLILSGATARGIGLLLWGGILVMNVDNVLKPRLISGQSNIHPVVVLLGVLGGLKLFGFIGLVAGPLTLALLIALIRFYEEEYLGLKAG
ncbi:MAG: AI-2E family transporter [Acidobacteria bacterium]|nr:AI-2E family transporter [Acidobacteriota bacterium]MCI0623809.1 AI-2E family transporter [Acidobacteriota bacterium]MCI0717376.1 AI-2E family transporter [Acidobacteriota bacterium]